MRFWDSSAIVPLVVAEASTRACEKWLDADPDAVLWILTRVEVISAVERRAREGSMARADRVRALADLGRIVTTASEVGDVSAVRALAPALLARHPLRAADALQLAAALVVASGDPASWTFVVLDRRLADAAEREGFQVLTS